MFAALCQSRNYICKETIGKWFPMKILHQNLWNENLSKDIKAAFARLLTNIYIDTEPRTQFKPLLCRIGRPYALEDHIESIKQERKIAYKIID